MKRLTISKLFLYRHRFGLGYFVLALTFIVTLITLPLFAPGGLSEAEMSSAVTSHSLNFQAILHGDIVDLPYHLLQKYSIRFLGLTYYAIKLPSLVIGLLLGFFLILLLNRWFKNNVACLASILTVLSSSFLYLATSGTPLIMLVFWPTVLLWLGSKIQGKTAPKPFYCFIFAVMLLLSLFTPYMPYLAAFIIIFALIHPHLRHTVKTLPRIPLALTSLIILAGLGVIIYSLIGHTSTITNLLFTNDFSLEQFKNNLITAFTPFFAWGGNVEGIFLAPLIGLATLTLAIAGLISTAKGFFASRNSIASYLIVFTVLISGLRPDCAFLLILPLSILIAHGIRYILEKWYGLFPENPYARIFGLIPIGTFLGIMIVSDINHFIFGYRYSPPVANQFTSDLVLIRDHLPEGSTILIPAGTLEYDFYKILENSRNLTVTSTPDLTLDTIASLGKWATPDKKYHLNRIITSSKSESSDRIYIYSSKGE